MYAQSKEEINVATSKCDRMLRSSKKINMRYKFSDLTKVHNSPFYTVVKLWNELLSDIQKCASKQEFKKMVKGYYYCISYMSIICSPSFML